MRIFRFAAVITFFVLGTSLRAQEEPLASTDKKPVKSRNLPNIDKKKVTKLKKIIRNKKKVKLKRDKQKIKKLVQSNLKKKRRKIQRRRRLALLRKARTRLETD